MMKPGGEAIAIFTELAQFEVRKRAVCASVARRGLHQLLLEFRFRRSVAAQISPFKAQGAFGSRLLP
uniref:Uncharacterized protein n=1 Tax=Erwinia amylovora ATCC BAA-2158 TaxID=889211 RepID=E5B7F2_ERWAM|nr:hypothetical protein predicted by Glimmer/Critica [Erwinia amylovora ATCC BAA-2158]